MLSFLTQINIGLVEFKWEGEDLGDLSTRQAARAANPPPPGILYLNFQSTVSMFKLN